MPAEGELRTEKVRRRNKQYSFMTVLGFQGDAAVVGKADPMSKL